MMSVIGESTHYLRLHVEIEISLDEPLDVLAQDAVVQTFQNLIMQHGTDYNLTGVEVQECTQCTVDHLT